MRKEKVSFRDPEYVTSGDIWITAVVSGPVGYLDTVVDKWTVAVCFGSVWLPVYGSGYLGGSGQMDKAGYTE